MKLKVNFILKTGVAGEIPILAVFNFGYKEFDVMKQTHVYKPLRYYTGIKVKREDWNAEERLPKDRSSRATLLQLEQKGTEIFNYLKANETVTPDRLKQELDVKLKGKHDKAIVSRVRIAEFIELEVLRESSIKDKTKEGYKTLKNRIVDFEEQTGRPLYSHELNEDLYNRFMDSIRERANRINTVWSIYKAFKAVLMRIARKYKIEVFSPTKELRSSDRVKAVTEDKIYLEFEHIKKILEYQPESDEMKNAKLILLTLLFTGCRYSDVHKIKPEYTYDKKGIVFQYARYFSEKTDTEVVVPILKPLQTAIVANNGEMAYRMKPQRFNELVKMITEEAGLNEEITLSYTDAKGKKQFVTRKQHDFVSSHIGRRSFVTNLINFIPITVLSKITGHSNSIPLPDFDVSETSVIFKYNKISLVDNAARFVKELKRQVKDNRDHFPFELV
jgi:integrase